MSVEKLIFYDNKNDKEITIQWDKQLKLIVVNGSEAKSGLWLDHSQAHLLMLYLQEKLGNSSISTDIKESKYWYCKHCRTLHAKDYVCERISK